MAQIQPEDLEAANSENFDNNNLSFSDPFDIITTKNVPIEHLLRWRKAVIARNYSNRFEYTLDIEEEEEMKQKLASVRSQVETIIANHRASDARHRPGPAHTIAECSGETASEITNTLFHDEQTLCAHCLGTGIQIKDGGFGITSQALVFMMRNHGLRTLKKYGGVKGLAKLLKTDLEKGVDGDDDDFQKRWRNFGRYYKRSSLDDSKCLLAWFFGDRGWTTLIVMGYISLCIDESKGWQDVDYFVGRALVSIVFAWMSSNIIAVLPRIYEKYQIDKLVEKKRHIQSEVIRGGRKMVVSMYDVVVGDVVTLENGDQVPGDGVLISSRSLVVDMLTLTGESKIVYKDSRNPFLMAGCTVTNGKGIMLVTSVGINTLWGYLREHEPYNLGEETPLQIRLNGFATFIAKVGCVLPFVFFLALLVKFFTGHIDDTYGFFQIKARQTNGGIACGVEELLLNTILMVILSILEEFPLNVTRMLAYFMGKILADNALVRRQSALETIGCATTIFINRGDILTRPQDTSNQGLKALVEVCQNAGIKVMICTTPIDKLSFVKALKRQGEVVAVIGSKVEDTSSLNEADVGIVMGTKISQITKESSDVIILDNDFASIVKLIKWGRTMYANIQKCIVFQLTVITVTLLINLLSVIFWSGVQLNIAQLLLVYFMVDVPGAYVFVTEPPTHDMMHKPPMARRGHLITNAMRKDLLIQIFYQVSAFLVLKTHGRRLLDLGNDVTSHADKVKDTVIFNSFVLCQLFNIFNVRNPFEFNIFKGISRNKLFMWFIGLTLMFQAIINFFLGRVFDTVKLNSKQWFISIFVAFLCWPLAAIRKIIPFKCSNRSAYEGISIYP